MPDRFWTSAMSITPHTGVAACSGSSFTYMGERMSVVFTLSARAAADVGSNVTTRHAGALARLNAANPATLALGAIDGATPLSARVNTAMGSSGTWANGEVTVTAIVSIDRVAAPDGPFNVLRVGVARVDQDGIQLNLYDLDVANSGSNTSRLVGTTA